MALQRGQSIWVTGNQAGAQEHVAASSMSSKEGVAEEGFLQMGKPLKMSGAKDMQSGAKDIQHPEGHNGAAVPRVWSQGGSKPFHIPVLTL